MLEEGIRNGKFHAVFVYEKNLNGLGFGFAACVKGAQGYCFYILFEVKVLQQLYRNLLKKSSIIRVQTGVGTERILTVRQNSPFTNDLSTTEYKFSL